MIAKNIQASEVRLEPQFSTCRFHSNGTANAKNIDEEKRSKKKMKEFSILMC